MQGQTNQLLMGKAYTTLVAAGLMLCIILSGCSNVYYATWEKLGKHKRDLLRDNVEAGRDEQVEAAEQFKDALTRLQELTGFEGGDLEETYRALNEDYERCVEKSEAVKDRIEDIDEIASDLFDEWEEELQSISSAQLRRKSRAKLDDTRDRYADLFRVMKKAERRMDPVLTVFRDQVLFLKHNLNASAIAGLKSEVADIELDIQELITDMNASISEAESFIKTLPE